MKFHVRVMTLVPAYLDITVDSTSPGEAESLAVATVRDEGRQQRDCVAHGEKWVGGDYEWTILDTLTTGDLDPDSFYADPDKTEEYDA